MMLPIFKETTSSPSDFFKILPADWREGIVPFWDNYSSTSKIFTLEIDGKIIGGGILFYHPAPDTLLYKQEALNIFENGLIYFGFLWIDPSKRGNDFGSFWINQLKKQFPKTNFWLSIEDLGLLNFYEKNDFKIYKEISLPYGKEWIMIQKNFKPLPTPT